MFVTLFLGLLNTDTGVVSFVNSGHPAPYLLGTDNRTVQIEAKAEMPLGLRRNARFAGGMFKINPGDALFVYSDGVIEASNANGDLFSLERLAQQLQAAHHAEPPELVTTIKAAVDAFTGTAPKADDFTALALRWHPVGPVVGRSGVEADK